ncbi:hypothetical protein CBF45_16900 [Bordetella sp. J329]|nr:hypothetical protein CBF45_16900 [Bordetella sp. J329]
MALTNRRRRLMEEYLLNLNATQAAIRAGYSAKTAGQIGDENLKSLESLRPSRTRTESYQALVS